MVVYGIYRQESATGALMSPLFWTSLPPPSPPHPSGLSQSTSFECPASYIKLSLVLCFSYGFSSSHVWMWELDCKESWALKNYCFWTVVLEKTLESPLDCKEIQPVHPKGDQSWVFTGRTDAEAETPILWPLDVRNWLVWKDPDAGKGWRWEEKGKTEDEMVGWHHQLSGHESE